jgi:4a-hydroxytetrahydrobiopterin dehydratase
MAKYCDEQGALCEEKVVEGTDTGVARDLADKVAVEGGDCCVPKKTS